MSAGVSLWIAPLITVLTVYAIYLFATASR
jgi:hypothetical protein